eukprot:232270-Pleurochrysis_carterae.AAC.2
MSRRATKLHIETRDRASYRDPRPSCTSRRRRTRDARARTRALALVAADRRVLRTGAAKARLRSLCTNRSVRLQPDAECL